MSKHALSDRVGQLRAGLRIELGRVVDGHRPLSIKREDGICDEQVAMVMGIEAGAELVRKQDRPDAG